MQTGLNTLEKPWIIVNEYVKVHERTTERTLCVSSSDCVTKLGGL